MSRSLVDSEAKVPRLASPPARPDETGNRRRRRHRASRAGPSTRTPAGPPGTATHPAPGPFGMDRAARGGGAITGTSPRSRPGTSSQVNANQDRPLVTPSPRGATGAAAAVRRRSGPGPGHRPLQPVAGSGSAGDRRARTVADGRLLTRPGGEFVRAIGPDARGDAGGSWPPPREGADAPSRLLRSGRVTGAAPGDAPSAPPRANPIR